MWNPNRRLPFISHKELQPSCHIARAKNQTKRFVKKLGSFPEAQWNSKGHFAAFGEFKSISSSIWIELFQMKKKISLTQWLISSEKQFLYSNCYLFEEVERGGCVCIEFITTKVILEGFIELIPCDFLEGSELLNQSSFFLFNFFFTFTFLLQCAHKWNVWCRRSGGVMDS